MDAMLPNIMIMLSNYTHFRLNTQEWYIFNNGIFKGENVSAVIHIWNVYTHNIYIDNEHFDDIKPSDKITKEATSQGPSGKNYQCLVARLYEGRTDGLGQTLDTL